VIVCSVSCAQLIGLMQAINVRGRV
jgi:hypothetical protein